MKPRFIVLGLPRSRTYWVSRFLSYGETECDHDPARHFTSRADAIDYLNRPGLAAVDTSLGLIWADIAPKLDRSISVVVVHRAITDVAASHRSLADRHPNNPILRQFLGVTGAAFEAHAGKLWDIPGWHIPYSALEKFLGCASLYTYCRDERLPVDWWTEMKDQRLECDRAGYMLDTWNNRLGVRAVFGPQEQVTAP